MTTMAFGREVHLAWRPAGSDPKYNRPRCNVRGSNLVITENVDEVTCDRCKNRRHKIVGSIAKAEGK